MHIFILGSLNTDFVLSCTRYPEDGETVKGQDFFVNSGGKGANQAIACARLGGEVSMCGRIGKDPYGTELKNNLALSGVNVECIKSTDGCMTGSALITLCGQNNRIIVSDGANITVSKKDVDDFLCSAKRGDLFLGQLEIPVETVGYALQVSKSKGMTTLLNPAPADSTILPFLRYTDILLPNETELSLLGGEEKLLEAGTQTLVVTLGGKGYKIVSKKKRTAFPCPSVKVVDTTAAGDTFCGALCTMLSKGKNLEESCRFASVAASLSCTRKGASASVPTLEEVLSFTKQILI